MIIWLLCLVYWFIYRARRREDYRTIVFEHARRHMKTGDLILFSGRHIPVGHPSNMLRRLVFLSATYVYRALDACEWGHVAMVYKHTDGELYLLHSEMQNDEADLCAGEPVTGVQVTPLEPKLARYRGYCVWRPINRALDHRGVFKFLRQTFHMNYSIPMDIWARLFDRLLSSHYRRRGLTDPPNVYCRQGMFCTEWLGALLEHCGVFDWRESPYKGYYLPSDFTHGRCELFLTREYNYGGEGLELLL